MTEDDDGETAYCRVKRKNAPEQVRTFSTEDAKRAGLLGKQGPWTQYPRRMRQMRARAFALRDVFPDVLRGMPVAEELQDMANAAPEPVPSGVKHMGNAEVVLPDWPADRWEAGLAKWVDGIASGKSLDDVLAWLGSKAKVTPEQEKQLRDEAAKRKQPEQAAPAADAPKIDPAKLQADMKAASNLDKLYELGSLIDAIADEAQRLRVTEVFDARVAELEQA